MFSTHPKKNFCFYVTFIWSSANAFNLDLSKNLKFGIELNKISVSPVQQSVKRNFDLTLKSLKKSQSIAINISLPTHCVKLDSASTADDTSCH